MPNTRELLLDLLRILDEKEETPINSFRDDPAGKDLVVANETDDVLRPQMGINNRIRIHANKHRFGAMSRIRARENKRLK
jgi:hypothetical protein